MEVSRIVVTLLATLFLLRTKNDQNLFEQNYVAHIIKVGNFPELGGFLTILFQKDSKSTDEKTFIVQSTCVLNVYDVFIAVKYKISSELAREHGCQGRPWTPAKIIIILWGRSRTPL